MIVKGASEQPHEYPSVLAALKDANILTIKPMPDGTFRVRERCDRYYCVYLTRDQMLAWADEIRAMALDT